MQLTKQIFILTFGLLLLAGPLGASARGLVPCGGYTNDQGTQRENPCTVQDVFILIAKATDWLIGMAGIYAVYKIINGGFYLVISLGNEEAITKWKGSITDAVVGFVLVLFAFMLVNTVVNFLLSRSFVTQSNSTCRIDLTNPLNYLTVNQQPCSSVNDANLHTTPTTPAK